jgi:FkbM family methyltransferase
MGKVELKKYISNALSGSLPRSMLTPIRQYSRDGHNELLFRDLVLNSDSTVIDFGGYVGDFSEEIRRRFDSEIHIFEPMPIFSKALNVRFEFNNKIHVHSHAVGLARREIFLAPDGEATSEFRGSDGLRCEMRALEETVLVEFSWVDVIAINIEGGEYELIQALDHSVILSKVGHLLIQFHKVGSDHVERRSECVAILAKTHVLEWSYEYVWESWRLRTELDPR